MPLTNARRECIPEILAEKAARRGGVPETIACLFFKVEVEHEEGEDPQQLGEEMARQLMKNYAVRSAELSNYVRVSEE